MDKSILKSNRSIIRQKADITERVKERWSKVWAQAHSAIWSKKKNSAKRLIRVAMIQGDNEDILKSRRAWLKRIFMCLVLLRAQYSDWIRYRQMRFVYLRLEAGSPKGTTLALWWTGSQRCKCAAEEDTALPNGKPESNWWGGVKLQLP